MCNPCVGTAEGEEMIEVWKTAVSHNDLRQKETPKKGTTRKEDKGFRQLFEAECRRLENEEMLHKR